MIFILKVSTSFSKQVSVYKSVGFFLFFSSFRLKAVRRIAQLQFYRNVH